MVVFARKSFLEFAIATSGFVEKKCVVGGQ
jgi:hypothetical protein